MSKATLLDFNRPVPPAEEEASATLTAIDRGIHDADEGRTVLIRRES